MAKKADQATTTASAAIEQAFNGLELAYASLADLEAMFRAIRADSDEHSAAYKLAGIGTYLADNWASDALQTKDEVEEYLKAEEEK